MKNIEQLPTPNVSEKTDGKRWKGIVLHLTLGAFNGAVEWLRMSSEERKRLTGSASASSAHFVFGRLGRTAQLAKLNQVTWHAGRINSPSVRAKAVLRKELFMYVNPNKDYLGFEFAGGYDIDNDGVLEAWEKLYTPQQIKQSVEVHLLIEEQLGYELPVILTHRDIAVDKPNLEIPRAMYMAELSKQRKAKVSPVVDPVTPEPVEPPVVEEVYEVRGKDIIIKKK